MDKDKSKSCPCMSRLAQCLLTPAFQATVGVASRSDSLLPKQLSVLQAGTAKWEIRASPPASKEEALAGRPADGYVCPFGRRGERQERGETSAVGPQSNSLQGLCNQGPEIDLN